MPFRADNETSVSTDIEQISVVTVEISSDPSRQQPQQIILNNTTKTNGSKNNLTAKTSKPNSKAMAKNSPNCPKTKNTNKTNTAKPPNKSPTTSANPAKARKRKQPCPKQQIHQSTIMGYVCK